MKPALFLAAIGAAYVSEGLGENIDFCPSDNS